MDEHLPCLNKIFLITKVNHRPTVTTCLLLSAFRSPDDDVLKQTTLENLGKLLYYCHLLAIVQQNILYIASLFKSRIEDLNISHFSLDREHKHTQTNTPTQCSSLKNAMITINSSSLLSCLHVAAPCVAEPG